MSNELSFDSLFGDEQIEIECPECNSSLSIKFSDAGKTITCPHCSTNITLTKDDNFDEAVDSLNDSLKKFENILDNF